MTILTIARHSFKEAIRKRILIATLLFSLAMILSAPFLPAMTDNDRVKLVQDVSLTAMTFLGVIVAVFISAYSLPSDVEEKRIFTIVPKPIRRFEVILGKQIGFLMVFGLILLVMGAVGDLLIRGVSTYSRIEITAPEAPLYYNGARVGAVGKGRELHVTGDHDGRYVVKLPDDLAIEEGAIPVSAVKYDITAEQVNVSRPDTAITYNGVEIARVSPEDATSSFMVREKRGDDYIIGLPEDLRIKQGEIPSEFTSEPEKSLINSKRIVKPAGYEIHNTGISAFEDKTLLLSLARSRIGELWHIDDIDTEQLPDSKMVHVRIALKGIFGITESELNSGSRSELKDFTVDDLAFWSGDQEYHARGSKAIWGDDYYVINAEVPRSILATGKLNLSLKKTSPEFINLSASFFAKSRYSIWHFRNLSIRRFPSTDKFRGVMEFNLRHRGVPANGGYVANTEFELSNPDTGKTQVVTVPIRNGKVVEFSYDRDLIGGDGNLDIRIKSIPKDFEVGVPVDRDTIRLLEDPVAFEVAYGKAIAFIFCQLMLVSTATVAASTFVSGGVAALAGFFIYFCGMLVNFINEVLKAGPGSLADPHGHGGESIANHWGTIEPILRGFVAITPDVSELDGKSFILQGIDIPTMHLLGGVGMTLIYGIVFIGFACLVFRRKELG